MGASGPYVVTVRRDDGPKLGWMVSEPRVLSRRAVATLEEAQQAAWDKCLGFDQAARDVAYSQLTEIRRGFSGGSVGPLPDGTVIEISRWTWEELCAESGCDSWEYAAEPDILAAFNAWEAQHGQ